MGAHTMGDWLSAMCEGSTEDATDAAEAKLKEQMDANDCDLCKDVLGSMLEGDDDDDKKDDGDDSDDNKCDADKTGSAETQCDQLFIMMDIFGFMMRECGPEFHDLMLEAA